MVVELERERGSATLWSVGVVLPDGRRVQEVFSRDGKVGVVFPLVGKGLEWEFWRGLNKFSLRERTTGRKFMFEEDKDTIVGRVGRSLLLFVEIVHDDKVDECDEDEWYFCFVCFVSFTDTFLLQNNEFQWCEGHCFTQTTHLYLNPSPSFPS